MFSQIISLSLESAERTVVVAGHATEKSAGEELACVSLYLQVLNIVERC